ncbi:MAG: response regulator transcription factor [Lewinellaceae bacterium]|nr:response regulator transcription factor [Saprospiraceae bacterium]MCB9312806.1 response regulator transcription factor [Lewinellaceae bacterium]
MKPIKLALVDDHLIFLKSLSALFEVEDDLDVVLTATSGEQFLDHIHAFPELEIDVLVLDLKMKGLSGIDCLKALKEEGRQIKTIILSMFDQSPFIHDAFSLGACGFITKDADPDSLLQAIHAVHTEGRYVNPSLSRLLVDTIMVKQKSALLLHPRQLLTNRELEVLLYICQGLSGPEIAHRMSRSIRTIDGHRQHLLEKTDSPNVAALVAWAFREGLVH